MTVKNSLYKNCGKAVRLLTKYQAGSRAPRVKYLLTYLLIPMSRFLLEKLTGFQLVKKFPVFYGTRRYITASTNARHLSLSSASSIQSIHPPPTSRRSISPSTPGSPMWSHSLKFSHQTLYNASSIPHWRYMPHPSHTSLFYRWLSSSLCSFLHSFVTSSISGPNILLYTLFSNTLSRRSSLNMSDQVSHPYITGKIQNLE